MMTIQKAEHDLVMSSQNAIIVCCLSSTNDENVLASLRNSDKSIQNRLVEQIFIHMNNIIYSQSYNSDMDSEKDSPRKNPNPENSTKGQRNTRHKQVKNVANSKAKALPVYMQSKTHNSPLNSPKHNVKNGRIKKLQNNKTKTQSAQRNIIHKGALGDITTENVYEIDAYAEDELGTFATFGVVPPTKKATKNRAGNKVEKRTIKRAGNKLRAM